MHVSESSAHGETLVHILRGQGHAALEGMRGASVGSTLTRVCVLFSCSPSRASGLYFGSHWSVMLIGSALMKSFVSSPVKSIALTSKLLYTVCVQQNESQYIGGGTRPTVHAASTAASSRLHSQHQPPPAPSTASSPKEGWGWAKGAVAEWRCELHRGAGRAHT